MEDQLYIINHQMTVDRLYIKEIYNKKLAQELMMAGKYKI